MYSCDPFCETNTSFAKKDKFGCHLQQDFTFFTRQVVYLKCLEENLGLEYVKNFSRVSKAPTFSQPSFLEF